MLLCSVVGFGNERNLKDLDLSYQIELGNKRKSRVFMCM